MKPTFPAENVQGQRAALASQVRAHPFLNGLSASQLETLIQFAAPTGFHPGQHIFHQRDPANAFYLILSGEVIVEADANGGGIQEVDRVHAGEVLGWSWLFPPYQWHFSARAAAPTQAVFFYGTWLRDQCEADKALGYELMKRLTEVFVRRLLKTRQRHLAQLNASHGQ